MELGLEEKTEQPETAVFNRDVSSELSSSSDLLNSVVEEKEHLQVYLRIRPFTAAESYTGEAQDCVTIESTDTVLVKPPVSCQAVRQSTAGTERPLLQTGQRFQFSQVYGPDTTQKQLYDGTVKDLVKDVLTGGNSLVFTYGVTNAGKTFTFLGPEADAGLLPRALSTIFNSIEEHVYSDISIRPHRCREFTRLTKEQQVEQILLKRSLFKQSREVDRNTTLLNSTIKTHHEGSLVGTAVTSDDRISLDLGEHTKFSVWVSFCEIYNENIHDLLEALPSSTQKRTALRLSQDVKGHSFVKDLRWVHVDTAEEAYRVLKLGKKNQSFSSTKLNQLSSRSHSIFSIRILKIEDVGTPRVSAISELCLCDLAGSERCAKTQNKGERLKEAGNINSSLHILGKCINALRHNQQAKLLQHVPFRESKLTHYLQSFLCGRGRACMIVNINQCASMYDETLNVLKFSAVAQKVVVLNSKNQQLLPERSSTEASFLLDSEEQPKRRRRSSVSVWDTSLEDVQEDEADECEDSLMDTTQCSSLEGTAEHDKILISKKTYQNQMALLGHLQVQLKQELAESLAMEARIRDEISKEFSQIFSEMQKDYDDRLAREREILEERAEKRLEIFKDLSQKMSRESHYQDRSAMDPFSAEMAEMESYPDAYLTGALDERSHAFERLEEQVSKYAGESSTQYGDRAALMSQLQERSLQVSTLEKQVSQLQRALEQRAHSHNSAHEQGTAEQLQQALAAVEKEKQAREEALAALEYQTVGRVEALASLEVERKAREQAQSTLSELQKTHRDMSRALEEEKRGKDSIRAALEEEKRAKEEMMASLREERRRSQEAKVRDDRQDHKMEEQLASLTEKNKARQKECEELHVEVKELKNKLQATEKKVSSETERGEKVSAELRAAQTKLDKLSSEVKDKTHQIQSLTQEVDNVKQELQTSVASSSLSINLLKDEISELRATLASEKENNKRKTNQITQMEKELASAKEQLAMEKLMSEQKLAELNDKLRRQSASKEEIENLKKKLAEKDQSLQRPLDDLKANLELQEKEKKQLRAKLEDEKLNMEKTKEKMLEQDANAKKQLEALQKQLDEQQAESDQLLCDAKLQLYEQQEIADKLRADLELANGKCSALQDYNKQTDDQAGRVREMERLLEEKDKVHKEKLAESVRRRESMQKKLEEREKEVAALQRSLDQREQAESQAVQETRRKEVERRRELLAKAEEAIAQKDAELEKKSMEITRLKQSSQQDVDRVQSLSTELRRREEHGNELQEKLADYKKQIQQVQKEISSMREEERGLKQRLSDLEKSKKQLQTDLANRDRTILNLKMEQSSHSKSDQTQELYQNASKELEAKNQIIENMRLALSEQEETQEQMEHVMEEKDHRVQELTNEVDKLKNLLLRKEGPSGHQPDNSSHELRVAKEEATQSQENLRVCLEKHRTERKAWMEEKLSLIGQAKDAEDRRNQDMRRFAEDREKYQRQQSQVESLSSQLSQKEQTMEQWRKDRDTLVSALEVQLQKLLSSQAQKDKLIQELQQSTPQAPPEAGDGVSVAELQAALSEREAEIHRLKEELQAAQTQGDNKQIKSSESPESEALVRKSRGRRDTRTSVISQSSASCPSVLDSSEISTDNGRTSRFPKPELEISFSPLQPNRMALRRQGEESAVTVKITRSARKRKSNEMDKNHIFRRSKRRATLQEEVEAENRRNTRTKVTPKLTPHQEEKPSAYGRHDSQSSLRSRKEGTLQKIGDFLQSSPTLLGSKAKKMMGLVSGRDMDPSGSSPSLRGKKKKRNLYRPEISSPMDMPPHPIISREPEEKESDHQIIKRCLRSRVVK
ncbi:kinesin-like protein KIF20B [Periophthalmus magnuspinnatus]|uniref:kinesin-like protein KIF20B n=1 Tax=Periophthalmus magnuspinnatus TaxID=409849 RepID=UPI0024369862|nr:kinesin-like protein KIF20B [Periophthalmus magnuspinnatus]